MCCAPVSYADAGGPVKAGRLQDSAGTWGTLAASFVINTSK